MRTIHFTKWKGPVANEAGGHGTDQPPVRPDVAYGEAAASLDHPVPGVLTPMFDPEKKTPARGGLRKNAAAALRDRQEEALQK